MLHHKKKNKPHFSKPYHSPSELIKSYLSLSSIADLQHPEPYYIRNLTITHSNLVSLQGIQQYQNLQILNIRYNNIVEAEEIYLIPSKQKLIQLNIQGNDVEYFAACTFPALKANGFVNLTFLNNKDYSRWGLKKQKAPSNKSIYSSLKKIEKDYTKTLKRTVKNNVREKYKLRMDELYEGEEEQATSRVSENIQRFNSVKQQQCQIDYECSPMKDISLSNANLVKSVKDYKINGEDLLNLRRNNGLSIDVENSKGSHLPITQPTATFASQRDKNNLPFRNLEKSQTSIVDEVQFDDEEDFQQISFESQIPQHPYRVSVVPSQFNKSIIKESRIMMMHNMNDLADSIYLKNLCKRIFNGLKPNNMPRQMGLY